MVSEKVACHCTRFRADIDYGTAEAATTYGLIGVKVWIFKGEVLDLDEAIVPAPAPAPAKANQG